MYLSTEPKIRCMATLRILGAMILCTSLYFGISAASNWKRALSVEEDFKSEQNRYAMQALGSTGVFAVIAETGFNAEGIAIRRVDDVIQRDRVACAITSASALLGLVLLFRRGRRVVLTTLAIAQY